MKIILSKQEAIKILTDLFVEVANNGLALGQGKISVGIELTEESE